MTERERAALYLRNLVFGVEDSLVSTVGLLAGLASAETSRSIIILTGIVYIFVESLSMAVGSFLAEKSVEEYHQKGATPFQFAFVAALIMFVSFVVAGLFPVLPYIFFDGTVALHASIGVSLLLLALLGGYNGKLSRVSVIRPALRMVILGGAAILLGVFVGQMFGV